MKKEDWLNGEWKSEPDKIQFTDKKTGYPCLIVRNNYSALCGYVGVSSNHKFFEIDCDCLPIAVHGGLTYSRKCLDGPEDSSICHKVDSGEDDNIWWFGFRKNTPKCNSRVNKRV